MENAVKNLQICLSSSEGGLEISTVQFAEMFNSLGHPSTVICAPDSFIENRCKSKNTAYLPLANAFFWQQRKKLIRIIERENIEVLFFHRLKDLKLGLGLKRLFPRLKIYGLAHIYVDRSKKDPLHRYLYSCLDGLISFTSVQSQALQKTLPIPPEKHLVIPHGVDLNKFRPQAKTAPAIINKRHELGASSQDLLIGVVGRFDPQKGQWEFVQAARQLLEKFPHLRFVLVGENTFNEPGTKEMCEKYIQEHDLGDRVHLLPFTHQIENFYSALDIFVMPSYKETFGLVLIEAMASGCACMSTSDGGPVEILDSGELGKLVEPKSVEALAQGLEDMIQNIETYRLKALRSQEKIERVYNLAVMRESYRNLIQGSAQTKI